jgi:predicted branched-subunit amino acid permease
MPTVTGTFVRVAARQRGETRAAIRAVAPLLVAYAPFALAIGATIADHPDPVAGWAATGVIYSGSAHLAVLGLLGAGSGLAAIVFTGLVINARLAVYSASIAHDWQGQGRGRRALAAFVLVDPIWVVTTGRAARPGGEAERRAFYLSAGVTMWVGWVALVSAGLVVGDRLGPGLGLELAVPLCLMASVARNLTSSPGQAAALAAGLTALAGNGWPGGSGLLAAIAVGALAGLFVQRRAT